MHPHAIEERLAAVQDVHRSLQEALLAAQGIHTQLQRRLQKTKEREAASRAPRSRALELNSSLWAPRAGKGIVFKVCTYLHEYAPRGPDLITVDPLGSRPKTPLLYCNGSGSNLPHRRPQSKSASCTSAPPSSRLLSPSPSPYPTQSPRSSTRCPGFLSHPLVCSKPPDHQGETNPLKGTFLSLANRSSGYVPWTVRPKPASRTEEGTGTRRRERRRAGFPAVHQPLGHVGRRCSGVARTQSYSGCVHIYPSIRIAL